MPAIGWVTAEGKKYSFTEAQAIATQAGIFEKFPAPVLLAMQDDRTDGHWLSPSAAGGCARQRVLKRTEDYYQDLESAWTTFTGHAYHGQIARSVSARSSEAEVYLEMPLHITMRDGQEHQMTMQGTADYIHYTYTGATVYDWKTVSDFIYYDKRLGQRVTRVLPSYEHQLQINLYGLMLRWSGIEVGGLHIWYVKSEGKKGVTRRMTSVDIMDMETLYHEACEIAEPLAWYEVTGELPQNGYDPEWTPCKFCPLVDRCLELAAGGK